MTVAEAWGRSKRRTARLVFVGTIVLTAFAAWFFTLPSWRKVASRRWPSTPAHVEATTKMSGDGREWVVAGSRVKIRFSYTPPGGVLREATQEVSLGWAQAHGIGEYGFIMSPDDFMRAGARPWEKIRCFFDPADPRRAVLEQSLGHADVPALLPLLIVVFGGLMFVAERRNAGRADDVAARAVSRNGTRWQVFASGDSLSATATADLTPESMFFTALVNWPALSATVRPHPAKLGDAVDVGLSIAGRRRWRRRVRVRLMLGPFNGSGRPRHARWSVDVFDGRMVPDETVHASIRLPRRGDLPGGVDDCWLWITARTMLGLPWSRTLWIALDADDGGGGR